MERDALALQTLLWWGLLPLLGLPFSCWMLRAGRAGFFKRLLVWLVVVPLFLGAAWLGGYAMGLLLLAAGAIACRELATLNGPGPASSGRQQAWLLLLALPWPLTAMLAPGQLREILVLPLLLLPLPLPCLRQCGQGTTPPRWLPAVLALSLGAGLACWVDLATRPEGFRLLLLAFSVVATGDIMAAVCGKFLGQRRPFPLLSPNKTIAGYLGGLLSGIVAGFLLAGAFPDLTRPALTLLCLVLGIAGAAGDLFASWVKRCYGVKDFSTLLGPMGGMLDRLDSLLGAGAAVFLLRLSLSWP